MGDVVPLFSDEPEAPEGQTVEVGRQVSYPENVFQSHGVALENLAELIEVRLRQALARTCAGRISNHDEGDPLCRERKCKSFMPLEASQCRFSCECAVRIAKQAAIDFMNLNCPQLMHQFGRFVESRATACARDWYTTLT